MSPTHSNKLGVRYRYYVSHAILQKRKAEAGSIARVPAPEIEKLVVDGVRKHRASIGEAEHPTAIDDRDLIERHVDSVIVKPQALQVRMVLTNEASAQTEEPSINDPAPHQLRTVQITLPWTCPSFAAVKGIIHAPTSKPAMKPERFAKMVSRAGVAAGLELKVHPHMLRHSCGYKLANDGVDTRAIQGYLGHRSITHTTRYTELAPQRFNGFWKD